MTAGRLAAIALIFVMAAVAWGVLGGSVVARTEQADSSLRGEVGSLWGEPQRQAAPSFSEAKKGGATLPIAGSRIRAAFDLDQRRKGLLWYATYGVDFDAVYSVKGGAADGPVNMIFTFPTAAGNYDGFAVRVDGREVPVTYRNGQAVARFDLPAGRTVEVGTGYRTQGLDSWTYVPVQEGVGVVEDFELEMLTDFREVDFPAGAVSPNLPKRVSGDGWALAWRYDSLVSGRPIALTMPKPTNPGPLASRIAFFAPVSLLFFFAAMVLLTATAKVRVHPMNYAFLAAGFFAFHLLFAYLVDRVDINIAFLIASLTSVGLCVGYLRMVLGTNRVLAEAAISQAVFLVLFSYTFFFEGLTGLAVTIGSVLTLAYFMWKTGRMDWDEAFASPPAPAPAPAPAST